MSDKNIAITLAVVGFALSFGLGFVDGRYLSLKKQQEQQPAPTAKPDTLWIHDTLTYQAPPPKERWIHDTVFVAVPDTVLIHKHDTTFVPIPRETTFYSDKDYEAWVTGFEATLDSIRVFPATAIVEVPVPVQMKSRNKPWGIGIQAGVTYLPQVKFTPYVGVGVSYNLITF